MEPTPSKQANQLNRIKECKEIINECKLELVKKKIACESSVLEYLEKMMQIEENKLNKQFRHLTKFHHSVVCTQKASNSENENMYQTENEINHIETVIKTHQNNITHNHSLFSTISVDWLESSLYLHEKVNKYKTENKKLIKKLQNMQSNTIQTTQNDTQKLKLLHRKYTQLSQQNTNLKQLLSDKQKYITNNIETLTDENKTLKENISQFYERAMNPLSEINNTLLSSNPITIALDNDTHIAFDSSHCSDDPSQLMHDVYNKLCLVLKHNKNFIAQQNKLCNEMKSESAKLLHSMGLQNIENEKTRDEEIKNLISETRINLERQYGEYNKVCDRKVETAKGECVQYRERMLSEAKEQIIEKKKNFETAKDLIRKKYEQEIGGIKKMFENKNKNLLNDVMALRTQLMTVKQKCNSDTQKKIEMYHNKLTKEFEAKITVKEGQIKERMKVIEMRYEMKVSELVKHSENEMNNERTQFAIQQEMMQSEIAKLSENFEKEIQILKRCRPHHIVHVPLNSTSNEENNSKANIGSSYSSQLQEYIKSNNNF